MVGARRLAFAGGPLALGLLLLPAPDGMAVEAWRLVPLALWMAVWWASEAVPVAVTALLPLVYLPAAGIADFRAAARPFAEPVIFLLMGGFLMAQGLTRWELHRRFALAVVDRMGRNPRLLALGFMTATAALSMWISNTATTLMMAPIALSVAHTVLGDRARGHPFAIALLLGVAYAASIGGLGTKIGTPPNAFVVGFLEETAGIEISFLGWMLYALPVVALLVPAAWWLLNHALYRYDAGELAAAHGVVRGMRLQLGRMTPAERRVAAVFALVALLWATATLWRRIPPLAPLGDAWIAIFGAVLMFVIPSGMPRSRAHADGRLLDWAHAARIPWGVLLLFGGGLSLARAIEQTDLAVWLGRQLEPLAAADPLFVVLGVVTLVIFLTELTSNTATVAALVPVVTALSTAPGVEIPPVLLAAPLAMAGSCAFMLPVATGPNAIVYASGDLTVAQMARAGFWLNLVGIVVITAVSLLLLPRLF